MRLILDLKLNVTNNMKKLLFALAAVATLSGSAFSQVVNPFQNVLALYDFNNLNNFNDPNKVTYCAPCLVATDLSLNTLSQSLHFFGGPDGSKFRCFAGWDKTYDYSFVRSDLSQEMNTLAFDVLVNPGEAISISGLSLDWKRPSENSVNSIQASIFWEDSSGAIQHRTSGPVAMNNTGLWNDLDFSFNQGSASFPTGIDADGETYHVELYAWGSQGSTLYLDNITLHGECAPIPEPGGAILLGAAGLMVLLRRRNRR
ncbi:MAG: PEP-CTERM sorting domain-containing protein [Verrucomicrobiaceae bacterium]|nr:PEP-CTERM sorting domain-containing protein [Verrucomicrobiaceae bacterium]